MNNGNVTRAAVGIAKRLSGRLKSILEAFVLGVKHGPFWHTWGQGSFRAKTLQGQAKAGAGEGRGRQAKAGRRGRQAKAGEAGRRGRQARQAGEGRGRQAKAGRRGRQARQAGAGRGKRKAPGEMPGAVIGAATQPFTTLKE
jgi:hypothetical protein